MGWPAAYEAPSHRRGYQTAKERFPVASLAVIDEGATCRIECTYLNGDRRLEVLPAYIAMNLCASLKTSVDLSDLIAVEPGGTG